jgi:murein DD-endopeptidase MepM/ murein hydrolase activator NlpD
MTTDIDYNAAQLAAGKLTVADVTELVRHWQATHPPLKVDGEAGPRTIASIAAARRPAPFLASPLPMLADGRTAVITSSFRPTDRPNHDGVDLFYRWMPGDYPDFVGDHGGAGTGPAGKPKWVVPSGVAAIAAAPGKIQRAGNSSTGYHVWIEHENGLRTGYFHLIDVRVTTGQRVAAGAPLGLVGDNPKDHDGRHLHFELSPVDTYEPIDPTPYFLPGAVA